MFFCEKCRYIFDITGNVKRKQVGGKINKAINNIFTKHINNEPYTEDDIAKITPGDLLHNEKFENMTKKEQTKIMAGIRAVNKQFFREKKIEEPIDDKKINTNAYFICKYCQNFKPIKPRTLIHSRDYSDGSDNLVDYSEMVYDQSLSRTRAYICKNPDCETHHNDELREAVLTKNNAYQIIYICTHCKYWFIG